MNISTLAGVSKWLTVLPITEYRFELSKQQFWDSMRLRHSCKSNNLLTSFPYGSKFDIQHNMSCKKGGLICIQHNDLRDLTANVRSVQGHRN